MENEENTTLPTPTDRPLGFWLRAVDALLTREFVQAFDADDVSRREWMLLNVIDGSIDAPWLTAKLARKGGRVRGLAERGWISETEDGWTLTDEGRAAKERLGAVVDGIRTKVSGAVSPEDYATTVASLEAIARELGWDETQRPERFGFGPFGKRGGRGFGPGVREGFGPRHGFGPRFGREGFGPRDGFGPRERHGFGPRHGSEHDHGFEHGHCAPHDRDRRHGERGHGGHRRGEHAYERGFTAGFDKGRAAASEPAA